MSKGARDPRETAAEIPDRHDPAMLAKRVDDLTGDECLPTGANFIQVAGGFVIKTPKEVTEEICSLMRYLRHETEMNSVQVAAALDYSKSAVSTHVRGKCSHWEPQETIDFRGVPKPPYMKEVTDTSKVLTPFGRSTYHLYADGEPACQSTADNYETWTDLEAVDVWNDPCKWCFPERQDDE